jgi:hypothetical protein
MSEIQKDPKREKQLKQIETIHRLATRLPWIVLAISLFAFILIFIQAYFLAK